MNIYYKNEKATLSCPQIVTGSSLDNIYDPMLELRADFSSEHILITGIYENFVAINSFCIGYTNAIRWKLLINNGSPAIAWTTIGQLYSGITSCVCPVARPGHTIEVGDLIISSHENSMGVYGRVTAVIAQNAVTVAYMGKPGEISDTIQGRISIFNFNETIYTNGFMLELEGDEPLYLGHLFLGQKTVLPRFAVEPETGINFNSEALRSFGGQVFGMKRITLENFKANFLRITSDEYKLMKEYVNAVQNVEPHIIDPYSEARDKFPPMYATLDIDEVSMTKRNENGFFYNGSLAWTEAK